MADPKKNVAFVFDAFLVDVSSRPNFKANPTLAVGDVTVSTDDGAWGNLTTLPTVTPAAGIGVKVSASAGEMNGDRVKIRFKDQTVPAEWDEVVYEMLPTAVTVDDLIRATTPANTLAVDVNGRVDVSKVLGAAINALIAGRLDVNTQVIGVDVVDATALKTDAVNEIRDAIFARAFGAAWGSKTFERMVEAMAAAVLGVTTGAGTVTELFKDPAGNTMVTVGNDGTNRTSSAIS